MQYLSVVFAYETRCKIETIGRFDKTKLPGSILHLSLNLIVRISAHVVHLGKMYLHFDVCAYSKAEYSKA